MITTIKIRAEQGKSINVSCSQNGKKVDMTVPSNIANVAGMLAEISVEMVKYNNNKKI